MKKVRVASLIWFCSLLDYSALAQHQVDLRGIVNVTDRHVALLRIDKENWEVQIGDHFEAGSKDKSFQVDVLSIDFTNETIKTRVDGEEYTNSLRQSYHPESVASWIHLQNADFKEAMELYGLLSDRTILLHPAVSTNSFSCDGFWAEPSPAKKDITTCFEKSLSQRNATSLEDGDRFLQVIPTEMAQAASLHAPNSPTVETETIAAGMVDFQRPSIYQVIQIYGRLIGREQKGTLPPFDCCCNGIYFKTTTPLTKPQVIYAFETLFRWNDAKITLNDDNTFSVAKISESK